MLARCLWLGLILQIWLPASAQDASRRMDPDVWFARPEVQASFAILNGLDSCYAAQVRYEKVDLEMLSGSEGEFFNRTDDMRLILDSNGVSVGRSHNHGFNLGARHFMWDNRYFAVGGRGFWNAHSKLVEFVQSTGEWEWQPCVDEPRHVMEWGTFFDGMGERIVALDPVDFGAESSGGPRLVYALDITEFQWAELGELNPVLDVYFKDRKAHAIDLKRFFIWAGLHKTVVLRKSDLKVILTSTFNRPMIKRVQEDLLESGSVLSHSTTQGHYRVMVHSLDGRQEQRALDWDVEGVFLANEEEAFPFYVPLKGNSLQESVEVEGPSDYWWVILLLSGAAFWIGRRSKSKAEAEPISRSHSPNEPTMAEMGLSALVRKFLDSGLDKLDTDSLNRLLGLEIEQSQETKRARRAQAIRLVNQEYRMRYGVDLIHRVRDENDRRRTTYVIKRHSGSA